MRWPEGFPKACQAEACMRILQDSDLEPFVAYLTESHLHTCTGSKY